MALNFVGDAATALDCSELYGFQAFADYMFLLRNRTSFSEALLQRCRVPICGTLWGYGVPDISGIGALVGYILATILAPILSILLLLAIRTPSSSKITRIFTSGLTVYFESAIYFAIAVQFASIAIIIKKDYETTRISFGGYEARSCSLVSTICLLPLLYPVSILSLIGARQHPVSSGTASIPSTPATNTGPDTGTDDNSHVTLSKPTTETAEIIITNTAKKSSRKDTPNARDDISQRQTYRLTIFCFAVLLSLYPFASQFLHSWTPSPIGQGRGDQGTTYVTEMEWAVLEGVCFGGRVERLTPQELTLIDAFHTIASCVLILYTMAILVPRCLRVMEGYYSAVVRTRERKLQADGGSHGANGIFAARREEQATPSPGDHNNPGREDVRNYTTPGIHETSSPVTAAAAHKHLSRVRRLLVIIEKLKLHCSTKQSRALQGFLFLVPLGLGIPLLWGFWRLRDLQGQLAVANTGDNNEAGEWGFGQVMAITIFLPVGVEMIFVGVGS